MVRYYTLRGVPFRLSTEGYSLRLKGCPFYNSSHNRFIVEGVALRFVGPDSEVGERRLNSTKGILGGHIRFSRGFVWKENGRDGRLRIGSR